MAAEVARKAAEMAEAARIAAEEERAAKEKLENWNAKIAAIKEASRKADEETARIAREK